MHLSASHLVGAFVLVAGLTSTSAHSIHRRGSQQHHKDLAERMAQPDANAAQDDAANFYARALNDAQAGKYRITRRAANPVGRAGQKKVIRKRADGATCKIRPSGQNATENATASDPSSTAAASTANEWWATSVCWFFAFLRHNTELSQLDRLPMRAAPPPGRPPAQPGPSPPRPPPGLPNPLRGRTPLRPPRRPPGPLPLPLPRLQPRPLTPVVEPPSTRSPTTSCWPSTTTSVAHVMPLPSSPTEVKTGSIAV